MTADRGLAGAYNHNITKMAEENINEDDKLCVIGYMGRNYFGRRNAAQMDEDFFYTTQDPTIYRARRIAEKMIEEYKELQHFEKNAAMMDNIDQWCRKELDRSLEYIIKADYEELENIRARYDNLPAGTIPPESDPRYNTYKKFMIETLYKRKFPRHSSFQTEMKNYFGIRG